MDKIVKTLIKKYYSKVLFVSIFVLLNMYILILPPRIIGKIVDLLYDTDGNKLEIKKYISFLLASAVALLVVRLPWRYMVGVISRGVERDLKNKLFDQLMKIKLVSLHNTKNGQLMSYFTKNVGEIRHFTYKIVAFGTRIIATFIIVIYQMINGANMKLTLITMCPIIITVALSIKIKEYIIKSYRKSQKCYTELSEFVQESTDGIRTTKAYSGEGRQLKEFIKRNKALKQSDNVVDFHATMLSICIHIGFGLCYGISLIYGSKMVLKGEISIGEFVAFNGYIGLFIGPVSWFSGVITGFERAKVAYQKLSKFFELEREKIAISTLKSTNTISGDIIIEDLSYNYIQTIEVALNHINLKIKEGETLGIIGTIGSGKTTLMNLLLRLYPVPNGKISIGGKDINDIPVEVLRKSICYITQDAFLFSSTLKDNVSLFRDNFEDEEILESTKSAVIHDEIDELDEGIYTIIGERGVDLSGGQKQRVVISRAFLQKSNIVIFDDIFSALDNRTEGQVLKNVKKLTKGKTCIIISNRISDIRDADNIIVLEEGNIVEQGKHDVLIKNNGLYSKLYAKQSSKEDSLLA